MEYAGLDLDIEKELGNVIQLITINQPEKAIKDLAKIVENINTMYYYIFNRR